MMSFDAPRALEMCLSRNIRPRANSIPGIGGRCHAIINGSWQGGWRFVSAISSNGLIEKDRKILKVPLSHIRVADLEEDPIIVPTQNESSTSSSSGSSNTASIQDTFGVSELNLFPTSGCHSSRKPFDVIFLSNRPSVSIVDYQTIRDIYFNVPSGSHSVLNNSEIDFNPARIPPRILMRRPECQTAIIDEIRGLLTCDETGRAALEVVDRFNNEYRNIPFIRSAMIVRLKTLNKYKARLCCRGDTVIAQSRVSAPTPHRACIKLFLAMCAAAGLGLASVDVSQAFLQSGNVAAGGKYLVEIPDYVMIPWQENRTLRRKKE